MALECVACGVLFLLIADRSVKLRLVFEIVVVTCAAQPKTCDDEYCTQEHSNELGAVYNECQEADRGEHGQADEKTPTPYVTRGVRSERQFHRVSPWFHVSPMKV